MDILNRLCEHGPEVIPAEKIPRHLRRSNRPPRPYHDNSRRTSSTVRLQLGTIRGSGHVSPRRFGRTHDEIETTNSNTTHCCCCCCCRCAAAGASKYIRFNQSSETEHRPVSDSNVVVGLVGLIAAAAADECAGYQAAGGLMINSLSFHRLVAQILSSTAFPVSGSKKHLRHLMKTFRGKGRWFGREGEVGEREDRGRRRARSA